MSFSKVIILALLMYLVGFFVAISITHNPNVPTNFVALTEKSKAECEANLPRNRKCVLVWKFVPETEISHTDEE